MIPPEILRQVRRIEIWTNRVVNETMAGRYESAFKGHGMEFDEVREYQPGDDIRSIDWNVTARSGRPHIKRFVEERELTLMFLVDVSRSMAFGSTRHLKSRVAAELCAILAFSAIKNQDKVGLLLFSDRVEHFLPPKKGSRHVLRLVRDVLTVQPTGSGTNPKVALDRLACVVHRKSVVFLISDFFSWDLGIPLAVANRRHDVIGVHIVDPRQEQMPALGWIRCADAETGRTFVMNTSAAKVRNAYSQWADDHNKSVAAMMRRAGVDLVQVRTNQPPLTPLIRLLQLRAARR